jgi:hypothetical protein
MRTHRNAGWIAITLLAAALLTAGPAGAVNIVINNLDGAGEGFNDPTPATPVGGNPGTTIGQQRLNVFQYAANLWGALLPGSETITVESYFDPLSCTSTSAVLGSAGPLTVWRDFGGVEFASTWYHAALANHQAGGDLDPATSEIRARFNSILGQTGCLDGIFWYYGYDGNEGSNIELLTVVLHELAHGLGFSTTTSGTTGQYLSGYPALYDRFAYDNTVALHWNQMTAPQRITSALNGGKLVWDGPVVSNFAKGFLAPKPVMVVNAPPAIAGTYDAGTATFGAQLDATGITGDVVLADDGTAPTSDACTALINGAQMAGKIALIDRGTCIFTVKAKNAQDAGAIAAIIVDNTATAPPAPLGGTDPTVVIPAVRITQADGNLIKAQLGVGVNVTLRLDHSLMAGADVNGRVMLYAPNPFESGSSVSHYDKSATPNLLMEPAINQDLSQNVDLTLPLLVDIGWWPRGTAVDPSRPPTAKLAQSAPNPFRASCTIRFDLTRADDVTLEVFDLSGRLVKRLPGGHLDAGSYTRDWDGTDASGSPAPSGIYLYRLKGGSISQARHMVLVR